MITYGEGNLLASEAEALVNSVNIVGVMGKGIALQFKKAYPENYKAYEKACRADEVQVGRMFTYSTGTLTHPRYIINFPTKRHWKGKSRLEDIRVGLEALVADIQRLEIHSIALPPLGCGNGGLDWAVVRPLIEKAFSPLADVDVVLYAPQLALEAESMPIATARPELTRARSLAIRLLGLYGVTGYGLTKLEIQKLMYFLQTAGEQLNLQFVKHQYGPYAENLNHLLQRLDGHYLRGYGDRNVRANIVVMPGAVEAAQNYLRSQTDAIQRLERVRQLIEGFETPYGMELLATVHWAGCEDANAAHDVDLAIAKVQQWSQRKRAYFDPDHIRDAWQRLREQGWLSSPEG